MTKIIAVYRAIYRWINRMMYNESNIADEKPLFLRETVKRLLPEFPTQTMPISLQ
jgi:hypothetical protein